MNEEKTTWQWRQGYDYATAKYKAELDRLRAELATWKKAHIELGEMYDRLRAENAELRRCIGSARTAIAGRDYRNALAELEDVIEELAKTAKEGE